VPPHRLVDFAVVSVDTQVCFVQYVYVLIHVISFVKASTHVIVFKEKKCKNILTVDAFLCTYHTA